MATAAPALAPLTNAGFITAREATRYARVAKKAGQFKKLQETLGKDIKERLQRGATVSDNAPVGLKVEGFSGQAPWKDAFIHLAQTAHPDIWEELVAGVELFKEKHHRLVVQPRA